MWSLHRLWKPVALVKALISRPTGTTMASQAVIVRGASVSTLDTSRGWNCLPFHSELLADGISNYHGMASALFFVPVTDLLNTLLLYVFDSSQ